MKKHNLSVRVFSVLLCVAMLCTFVPFTSMAAAKSLFVGGVEVTAQNADDIFGDGTARYDADSKTLTLQDATVTAFYCVAAEDVCYGIYAEEDLTVLVNGGNSLNLSAADCGAVMGIASEGDLTVRGEGDLSVVVPSVNNTSAALYAEKALTYAVTGHSVLRAAYAAQSYALYSLSGDISFECAAAYGLYGATAVFSAYPTFQTPTALHSAVGYVNYDKSGESKLLSNDHGQAVVDTLRVMENTPDETDVYVCNVPITSSNAHDVLGDGTVSYDFDTNELILNNAHLTDITYVQGGIEQAAVIFAEARNLTVRLIGDNVLDGSGYTVADTLLWRSHGILVSFNDLTLVGDGSLTCKAGEAVYSSGVACRSLYVQTAGDLAFYGANTDNEDVYSTGIYLDDYYGSASAYFGGSKFAAGEEHGILADGADAAIYGGYTYDSNVYDRYYADNAGSAYLIKSDSDEECANAKRLFFKSAAVASYHLSVCGTQVTSQNCGDVLGDGTVFYNPKNYVLTLNHANLTAAAGENGDLAAISIGYERPVTVKLIGDNTIDFTDFAVDNTVTALKGIAALSDVNLKGDRLSVVAGKTETATVYGLSLADGTLFADNDGGLTVTLASENSLGIQANTVSLTKPSIRVSAAVAMQCKTIYKSDFADYYAATSYGEEMALVNDTLSVASLALYKEFQIRDKDYHLTVSDVAVTAKNRTDVLGDGTVHYDPIKGILYLKNAHITAERTGIVASGVPLTVNLQGDNTIEILNDEGDAFGVRVDDYTLTITGNGSLDMILRGSLSVVGMQCRDLVLENGGTINVNVGDGAINVEGIVGSNSMTCKGSGDVVVNVGQVVSYGCGIQCGALSHTGSGNLIADIDGGNFVTALSCWEDVISTGRGRICATAGEGNMSYGVQASRIDIQKTQMASEGYFFGGASAALSINFTVTMGSYVLSASLETEGDARVSNPSGSFDNYKRVWFTPPYGINAVEDVVADCTTAEVPLSWSYTGKAPDYVYVYADENKDGVFETEKLKADGSTTSLTLNGNYYGQYSRSWVILACYGGEKGGDSTTTVYSTPFTVSFYETFDEVWFYLDTPQIGYTPPYELEVGLHDYEMLSEPYLQWYKLAENGDAVLMQPTDTFVGGQSYKAQVVCEIADSVRFSENAKVESSNCVGELSMETDYAHNLLYLTAEFSPLQEVVNNIVINLTEPEEGMTPQGLNPSIRGKLVSDATVNILADEPTFLWKYNAWSDTYDEKTAAVLDDTAEFAGGDCYAVQITIPLKEQYKADVNHLDYIVNGFYYSAWGDNTTYDVENNVLTYTHYVGQLLKTVRSVSLWLDEPAVGESVSSLGVYVEDDELENRVDDIEVTWYKKLDETSFGKMSNTDLFEEGGVYKAEIVVDFEGYVVLIYGVPTTVNGATVKSSIEDYNNLHATVEFEALSASTELTEMDVTITQPVAGRAVKNTLGAVLDDDKVAYYYTRWYEYREEGSTYSQMDDEAVFEEGKQYLAETRVSLKVGYVFSDNAVLTVNGEENENNFGDGKTGWVSFFCEPLSTPVITLAATGSTVLPWEDASRASIPFAAEFNFAPESDEGKTITLTVKDANGNTVFAKEYDSVPVDLFADLSGNEIAAGTYTVTVSALYYGGVVTSNEVAVTIEPEVTTETTTATATETKATATATETEATVTNTETTATETGASVAVCGDANGDGAVNMKDVLTLRKYLAGMEVAMDMASADVNGDGTVNMKDVLVLRKFLAGLIPILGPNV